jgi:exosortase/archaeosortase
MKEFWRFISILISLSGFLVVGAVLLLRGEGFTTTVVRAVTTFAALWVVLGVLRALAGMQNED